MTTEAIKAKASELAALYVAKSNGKTLEYNTQSIGWVDNGSTSGPDMQSDLSRWRVKPEPRRMWRVDSRIWETESKKIADEWSAKGLIVTEWMEVLP